MKIRDKLFESEFSKKLMKSIGIVINKWSSIHSNKLKEYLDSGKSLEIITLESVGTESEKEIYNIAQKFWAIQETLEDLDKVFIFLQIDRSHILKVYPLIKTQNEYFKYHIENFIIRINTLLDLTGKIGNLLYNTGIDDKICNGYNFKEKIKKTKPDIATLIENILVHAKEIKQRRHQKLHNGKLEIDELEEISIWEDYYDVLQIDFSNSLLVSMTDERINTMITTLKKFATDLVEKVNIFLDISLNKI